MKDIKSEKLLNQNNIISSKNELNQNNINIISNKLKPDKTNNNLFQEAAEKIILGDNRPSGKSGIKLKTRYTNTDEGLKYLKKNNSELSDLRTTNPDIKTRFHKYSNQSKFKNTQNEYYINKIAINLEDLLIQEEHLWMILTSIRCCNDYINFAEEYLDFSQVTSIQNLDIFFEQKQIKNVVKKYQIYEYTSVCCSVLVIVMNKMKENCLSHLKNIFYYLHQNILLIIQMLINKIDKDYIMNVWVNHLKEIIFERLEPENKKMGPKDDELFHLTQNCKMLNNMLNNFLDIYFKSGIKLEKFMRQFESDIYAFIKSYLKILNDSNYDSIKCIKTLDNKNKDKENINNITSNNQEIANCPSLFYIKATLSKIKIELIKAVIFHQSMSAYLYKPPEPYLPPLDKSKYIYSLVLDLDETLIHSNSETGQTLIRPGTVEFLNALAPLFEIIIFTAGMQDYADKVINEIDKTKTLIKHRLYREHTTITKNTNVKDMSKLGRDLSKLLIIDNISENFKKQSENGIFITPWFGNPQDRELFDLIPLLENIAYKKVKDVRKVMRKIRDKLIQLFLGGDPTPIKSLNKFFEI